MIIIKVFLHGRPDWHLPFLEGRPEVNPTLLRLYADNLKEHLYRASSIVNKLQKNGWCLLEAYGAIYSLEYCKFDIDSNEAKSEILVMGITENVIIEELDLEELW